MSIDIDFTKLTCICTHVFFKVTNYKYCLTWWWVVRCAATNWPELVGKVSDMMPTVSSRGNSKRLNTEREGAEHPVRVWKHRSRMKWSGCYTYLVMGWLVGGYKLPQQMRKLDTEQEERHRDGIRESADRQKECLNSLHNGSEFEGEDGRWKDTEDTNKSKQAKATKWRILDKFRISDASSESRVVLVTCCVIWRRKARQLFVVAKLEACIIW